VTETVGVFGGTFDPIHVGHLAAVDDAASLLGLSRVLFVPNHVPPHKRDRSVTSPDERAEMVRLAIAGNPRFELSTVELERGGASFTLDTLRHLRRELVPDERLVFLLGCDALGALHTWHQPERLIQEFDMVLMDRPTGEALEWETVESRFPGIRARVRTVHVAQLEISGDDIRRRVADGRPVRYLVTPAVAEYIVERGLYRGRLAGDDARGSG